jgi:hypothetical protein
MIAQLEFKFKKLSKDLQYLIYKKISFVPYLIVVEFDFNEYEDDSEETVSHEPYISIYISSINISDENTGKNIELRNDTDLYQIFEIILKESSELYIN